MHPAPPPPDRSRPTRIGVWTFAALVAVLAALALAWTVTPLARLLDPGVLIAYEREVRAWPLAPLAIIVVHVLSGLIAAPGMLMIAATVLLFGAWPGALYALLGMLANGITVYAIGRFGARRAVDQWLAARAGSRLDGLNRLLARRGIVTIALVRLAPVPFSLVNILAGASRIGFADFVLGTAIGLLPVIALLAGFASRFEVWLEHPGAQSLVMLAGVVLLMVGVAGGLRYWAVRRSRES